MVRTGSLYIILRSAHTVYLCVLCGFENKQRLFPYTALADWFLQPRWSVFTARYGLNRQLYSSQISDEILAMLTIFSLCSQLRHPPTPSHFPQTIPCVTQQFIIYVHYPQ